MRFRRSFRITSALLGLFSLISLVSFIACTGGDPDIDSDDAGTDAPNGDTPGADVSTAGDSGSDVALDVRCSPLQPFGAAVPVTSLSTADEDRNASFSTDELTAYLIRTYVDDAGASRRAVFAATRSSRDEAFGQPFLVSGLEGLELADNASVTDDGLTLYVQGQRPADGAVTPPDIFRATRPTKSTSFGALSEVTEVNSTEVDIDPFITPDGKTLYFVSGRADAGETRIYRADWNGISFGEPVLLDELIPGATGQPVPSHDGLTLYFASRRQPTLGGFDIWVATRMNALGDFGTLTHVESLSSPTLDIPLWYSPDECRLYLASDREGGAGGRDIYLATRPY